MSWRWVWLRSRITACAVSGVIWLIAACLAPALMAGLLVIATVAIVGWRSGLLPRCRYGARSATKDEAAILLRTLVPIAGLRGRNQPSLWVSNRLGCDVRALEERTLVVSGRLVGWVRDGRIADVAVCELVVRALALAPVAHSRLVAAVQLFCVPWIMLATLARPASSVAGRLRPLVWIFALMAAADLYRRGQLIPILLLVLLVVATVTTPRFDRAWAGRRQVMADDAVRRHLPAHAVEPERGSAEGLFFASPMPTREGDTR